MSQIIETDLVLPTPLAVSLTKDIKPRRDENGNLQNAPTQDDKDGGITVWTDDV